MFPFSTKPFSFTVNENVTDVKARLLIKVKKRQFLKWYRDYEWVGKFNNDRYIIEQAQFWERNSFRPIIVFSVAANGSHTLVKGYYRLDYSVTAFPFMIIFFGIYISIEIGNIMPFITTVIFAAILCFLLIYPFFLLSYKKAEREFKALITWSFISSI